MEKQKVPFVLELSDELGHRLNEQAAQHGLTPEKYMEKLIEAEFGEENDEPEQKTL